MLKKHVMLAEKLGMHRRNIIMPDIGDCIELSLNSMKKVGTVPAGIRLIDGAGSGGTDSNVLRDRMILAEEGICVVGITYSAKSGAVLSGPDVMTKGLLYSQEMDEHIMDTKSVILETLAKINLAGEDPTNIRNSIRKEVQNFFMKEVKRRPMVITMLQKVDA